MRENTPGFLIRRELGWRDSRGADGALARSNVLSSELFFDLRDHGWVVREVTAQRFDRAERFRTDVMLKSFDVVSDDLFGEAELAEKIRQ